MAGMIMPKVIAMTTKRRTKTRKKFLYSATEISLSGLLVLTAISSRASNLSHNQYYLLMDPDYRQAASWNLKKHMYRWAIM